MKNLFLFLIILLNSFMAFGANIGDDTVYIGQRGSTDDKFLIFRDANSSHISVDHTDGYFLFGDGANTANKRIVFDIGLGASNPFFEWDFTKGKIRFSNDGSGIKDIGSGSGGGGGDNFNNGFTADDNANAEDGTTGWTASAGTFAVSSSDPLEGDQSFTWTPAAQNDTLDSIELDFDKDIFKGRACQAEIEYIGGDENLTLKVLNGDDEELGSLALIAHTVSSPESVFFLCPSAADISGDADKGDIYLRIENTGASASAQIKWDKSYLGTLKGLSESTLPDTFVAYSVGNSGAPSDLIESVDWIDGLCTRPGLGSYSCSFITGVFSEAPSCQVTPQRGSGADRMVLITSLDETGITLEIDNNAGTASDSSFQLSCQKMGADAKQTVQVYKSIPKLVQNENEFSASFDGSEGVSPVAVNSESHSGVITCTRSSAGIFNCTINGLSLTEVPAVQCTVSQNESGAGTRICTVRSKTTTTFDVNVNNTSGAEDRDFDVTVTKQGADYREGRTQNISLAGIAVNSYAEQSQKQVRVESCTVSNSGTPTTANDLCDSWIDSLTDNGTGDVTLNFISGTFQEAPACTSSTLNVNGNRDNNVSAITSNSVQVQTVVRPSTADDHDFVVTCVGKK